MESKYVKAINALTPKAERYANGKVHRGKYDSHDAYSYDWNVAYHGKMAELAEAAGLRARRGSRRPPILTGC